MILYDMYAGRVKHEPNKAVQRVEGGVEHEDQGGQEGGQGEAQGDLEGALYKSDERFP